MAMLLAIVSFVILPSCGQPDSGSTSKKIKTVSATEVSATSALLTGEIGVEIAEYKSVEFGMLISQNEKELISFKGKNISGKRLIGQTFSVEANGLSEETKYFYRAYLFLNDIQEEYGEVKSFLTDKKDKTNVEMVNLGLSVKWATMNVGATAPEKYGYYFAWGETSEKSDYSWSTYKYCKGTETTMTKYCKSSSYGTVDNKTTLEADDDAAHVNWGGTWRMPTDAEWDELREQCTWTWTTQNNINGYLVTSKKNGNSIFLPAAGFRSDADLDYVGSYGNYWSSSLGEYSSDFAYGVFFDSNYVDECYYYRYVGLSVRPVCP